MNGDDKEPAHLTTEAKKPYSQPSARWRLGNCRCDSPPVQGPENWGSPCCTSKLEGREDEMSTLEQ